MKFYQKISNNSKVLKRIILFFLVLFSLILLGAFSFRGYFLNQVIAKVENRLKNNYGQDFSYSSKGFRGLNTVYFEGLSLNASSPEAVPEISQDWLEISRIEVSVSIWNLMLNRVKLNALRIHDATLLYIEKDSISNLDEFYRKRQSVKPSSNFASNKASSDGFSRKFEELWDVLNRFLPENLKIDNVEVLFSQDSTLQNFKVSDFLMRNGRFSSSLFVDNEEAYQFKGDINFDQNKGFLQIASLKKDLEIAVLKEKFNLSLSFDTLDFELNKIVFTRNGKVKIEGTSQIREFSLIHPRISVDSLIVPAWEAQWSWEIGEDYIELSEGSEVILKKARVKPFIRLSKSSDSTKHFLAQLEIPLIAAQDFFDAIPKGLFPSIEGLRAKGKLGFKMKVDLDENSLDSLQFEAEMLKEDFKVNSWGKANPGIMNVSFMHEPYEDRFNPAPFWVGSSNPNFVPLEQISPLFKNAILTTEDPSFFNHSGFVMDAFKESIITNYKQKAFVRGGSTISMQLIKNVFLHRNKTVTRKIEEIFLVWLMENPRQVSKEKQFETYLNIIEFGYGVYGIGPGAQHYFAKHPSQLSVGESIFLASIIPKPKRGMYYFDEFGQLKSSVKPYFAFVGNIMARKGLIQEDFTGDYGFSTVRLKQGARPLPPEESFSDSLIIEIPFITLPVNPLKN